MILDGVVSIDKSVAYIVAQSDDNKATLHLAICEGNVEIS